MSSLLRKFLTVFLLGIMLPAEEPSRRLGMLSKCRRLWNKQLGSCSLMDWTAGYTGLGS